MPATKQLKSVGPVIERVLADRSIQDQLLEAGDHLQAAYRLVNRRKAKAADDKRLYTHLRKGAAALRKASASATEPQRPPVGKVLVVVLVAGGVGAALANKGVREQLTGAVGGGGSEPQA